MHIYACPFITVAYPAYAYAVLVIYKQTPIAATRLVLTVVILVQ